MNILTIQPNAPIRPDFIIEFFGILNSIEKPIVAQKEKTNSFNISN